MVVSGVILRVTIVVTHTKGPISLLITTHEPPSKVSKYLLMVQILQYPITRKCTIFPTVWGPLYSNKRFISSTVVLIAVHTPQEANLHPETLEPHP